MLIGPMVKTWDDWANVYDDLEVWHGIIREILKREGIPYHKLEKGYPGTSAVFMIDRRYVLKIYPGMFLKDHEREWPVLRLLETAYIKPLLLATGMFQDGTLKWPYAVLRFIEGTAYRDLAGQLSGRERQQFIKELAHKLRRIHSLSYEKLQGDPAYEWKVSEKVIRSSVEKAVGLPFFKNDAFQRDLSLFIQRERDGLEQQKEVFVHGDLTEDHLFFNKNEHGEWVFTDIIDWGDAHIAPAAYDFVVLWADIFSTRPKEWADFLRCYGDECDPANPGFQRLFVAMLFLHPFSCDLIANVYNSRPSYERPSTFQSMASFIRWVF